LFHEGVIVSTRKYVYDAGSNEDAIKGLMQAQHKVVMKDLKRGAFDDKIDQYLGGNPELLPRSPDSVGSAEAGGGKRASRPSMPDVVVPEEPAPSAPDPAVSRLATKPGPHPAELQEPAQARTRTAERKSVPSAVRTNLPPPPSDDLDPPTLLDSAAASKAAASAAASKGTVKPQIQIIDSGPIQLDEDEVIQLQRMRQSAHSDGVPGAISTPPSSGARSTEKRSSVDAASLPPGRPIQRPPSQGMPAARPVTNGDDGSADPERPGQYSQHKRPSQRIPLEGLKGERPPGASPTAGAARPGTPGIVPPRTISPRGPVRAGDTGPRPAGRPRTPTPARVSTSLPAAGRAPSGNSSGVVMSRPAVIVGAPAKPATPPRVRKAREEEGRGFGQGLISEKSLDEVILAYLSEDADEK
jgi:hypothetical protein